MDEGITTSFGIADEPVKRSWGSHTGLRTGSFAVLPNVDVDSVRMNHSEEAET